MYTHKHNYKKHTHTHICIQTHNHTQILTTHKKQAHSVHFVFAHSHIKKNTQMLLAKLLGVCTISELIAGGIYVAAHTLDLWSLDLSTSRLLLLLENYNAIFTWFTIHKGWLSFYLGRVDICGWLSMHKKYIFVTISSGLINCNINQMFYKDIPENTLNFT